MPSLPSSREGSAFSAAPHPGCLGVLRGQAGRKGLLTHVSDSSLGQRGRRRVLIAWSLQTRKESLVLEAAAEFRVGGRG